MFLLLVLVFKVVLQMAVDFTNISDIITATATLATPLMSLLQGFIPLAVFVIVVGIVMKFIKNVLGVVDDFVHF